MNKNTKTKLYQKRTQIGMSVDDLSIRSGISIWTIRSYEQGRRNINNAGAEKIIAIAKALGCNTEELLEK